MRKKSLKYSLIPISISALILAGCATVVNLVTEPVPEDEPFLLASDPQQSALLIVSVDVILDPSIDVFRDDLVDKGISKLLGTGKKTGFIRELKIADENGKEFSSRLLNTKKGAVIDPSHDLFVVFDGLPQGVYRLSAASAVFTLSNSERKEYFDCEYNLEWDQMTYQNKPDWSSLNCPYRADVDFSFKDGADSAVGPIQISNGQVSHIGHLLIVENHKLSDYRTERKKIDDRWQVVLDHGHSIEMVIRSDPKPGVETKAIHQLAGDNPESGWQPILQELDRPLSR